MSWTTGSSASLNSTYTGKTPSSNVYFGFDKNALFNTLTGSHFKFKESGYKSHVHEVRIPHGSVSGAKVVFYKVGDSKIPNGISETFRLNMVPAFRPSMAIYGDMGNDVTIKQLIDILLADINIGAINSIMHIGDMAYDLHTAFGLGGDVFMNQLMPISTRYVIELLSVNFNS